MSGPSPSLAAVLQSLHEATLPVERQKLRAIINEADVLYCGAMHWTGVTLLEHALGVLQLLLLFQPDADTVTACILQHAPEDKRMTPIELQEEYGPRVRSLVCGVYLLSHVN